MTHRKSHKHDHHRPQYHFRPDANWMNDPNGPLFFENQHHLFYQYNPSGAFHGNIHWGHAISKDLLHWQHLPIALAPDREGPDKDGIYSGCAVVHNGVPTLIYTGIQPETQCLATTTDMIHFSKYEGNPVIATPPPGLEITGFRDPYVWREDDGWYMALGSGLKGVGGAVLLYRSQDLRHWDYLHPLCLGDKAMTERDMWECPNFFPLGNKHVLIVSPYGKVRYWTGAYRNHRFIPELAGFIDVGESYYAPNTFVDGQGRLIMWGWLKEQRSGDAQLEAGWSGVMSLPRVLHLMPDNTIGMKPAEEVKLLREAHQSLEALEINSNSLKYLEDFHGNQLEIIAEFATAGASEFGLIVSASPDGEEYTRIGVNLEQARLFIDTTCSSLTNMVYKGVFGGSLTHPPKSTLRLHVFIDHSVIEVFADNASCLSARVYPTRTDAIQIGLFAEAGKGQLHALKMWKLKSASSVSHLESRYPFRSYKKD